MNSDLCIILKILKLTRKKIESAVNRIEGIASGSTHNSFLRLRHLKRGLVKTIKQIKLKCDEMLLECEALEDAKEIINLTTPAYLRQSHPQFGSEGFRTEPRITQNIEDSSFDGDNTTIPEQSNTYFFGSKAKLRSLVDASRANGGFRKNNFSMRYRASKTSVYDEDELNRTQSGYIDIKDLGIRPQNSRLRTAGPIRETELYQSYDSKIDRGEVIQEAHHLSEENSELQQGGFKLQNLSKLQTNPSNLSQIDLRTAAFGDEIDDLGVQGMPGDGFMTFKSKKKNKSTSTKPDEKWVPRIEFMDLGQDQLQNDQTPILFDQKNHNIFRTKCLFVLSYPKVFFSSMSIELENRPISPFFEVNKNKSVLVRGPSEKNYVILRRNSGFSMIKDGLIISFDNKSKKN